MIVKVCRDCGEEYRPEIERCADCGGELETGDLSEDGPPLLPRRRSSSDDEPDDRPPGDYSPISWAATAAELTPRADALVEAGIPFYLRPRESSPGERSGYEIRVRREEWPQALQSFEAAARAAAAASRREDDEEDGETADGEADTIRDGVIVDASPAPVASESSADDGRCPACGAHVTPGAPECPDCGLSLGAPPDAE